MNSVLHNLGWLIRREALEHRQHLTGGFWLGLVLIGLSATLAIATLFHVPLPHAPLHGVQIRINGQNALSDLQTIPADADAGDMTELGSALTLFFYGILLLYALGLAASVFSYGLSCLFDERRDRSILFWKSLPVRDSETVAAKAVFAMFMLPLAWGLTGLAAGWLCLGCVCLALAQAGMNLGLVFAHTHLLAFTGALLAGLPVYLLLLMPATGWSMLCSAITKRHPALIALLVPALFSLIGVMGLANPVWNLFIARVFPLDFIQAFHAAAETGRVGAALPIVWAPLITSGLWIGVACSLLFLGLAAFHRRHRTVPV